jgi:hypothetical protein
MSNTSLARLSYAFGITSEFRGRMTHPDVWNTGAGSTRFRAFRRFTRRRRRTASPVSRGGEFMRKFGEGFRAEIEQSSTTPVPHFGFAERSTFARVIPFEWASLEIGSLGHVITASGRGKSGYFPRGGIASPASRQLFVHRLHVRFESRPQFLGVDSLKKEHPLSVYRF